MARYTSKQKENVARKLQLINIKSDKDVLNMKVSELKKMKAVDAKEIITIRDIEIIWLIQDAIKDGNMFGFLVNDTN